MPAPVTATAHPRPGTWPSPATPAAGRCGTGPGASAVSGQRCGCMRVPCAGAEPGKKSCRLRKVKGARGPLTPQVTRGLPPSAASEALPVRLAARGRVRCAQNRIIATPATSPIAPTPTSAYSAFCLYQQAQR